MITSAHLHAQDLSTPLMGSSKQGSFNQRFILFIRPPEHESQLSSKKTRLHYGSTSHDFNMGVKRFCPKCFCRSVSPIFLSAIPHLGERYTGVELSIPSNPTFLKTCALPTVSVWLRIRHSSYAVLVSNGRSQYIHNQYTCRALYNSLT